MVVVIMSQEAKVTCAMCGKIILQHKIFDETIDNDKYVFDSQDCVIFFKKFKSLYGDSLKFD